MNEKYSLKIIQHGKTQQTRLLRSGAGMAGQAVVIQAADAARYQLVNVVTLTSPAKLQLKRVGDALHLVLPGGDIEAPDLVIQDYFKVIGVSLQGSAISGEWMTYDTANLATNPATSGTESFSSNAADKTFNVSLGGNGVFDTFAEHPWLWAGGIVGVAAAAGGGGGASASSTTDATPLDIIQTYANAVAGAGVAAPTLATYKSAGVKALANLSETTASSDIDSTTVTGALGVTSAAWLATLNSALDKRTDGSTLTVAQIQAMVDSYYRILSEADAVVNTTTDVDVYPAVAASDPTSTDYTNIGATVGNAKSVDLLNDFVGQSAKTAVDTVDELNVVAKAAYNVMYQAGMTTAPSGTAPAFYTLDADWIAGLTALGVTGVTTSNITAVKAAIAGHADGTAVDTVQEIKDLLKVTIALQQLKDYANAINGAGVTAPTLTTYKDAGVKGLTSLSETTASSDIDSTTVTGALGVTSAAWLATLNSALDKRTDGSTLTVAQIQAMVDSYYRILSEADAVVNTTTDVDVYPAVAASDPTSTDYTNIGATVGNAKSVDLLNDFVGQSAKTAVDTVDELNVVAKAAYNVMYQAGMTTAPSGTAPAFYTLDADWIAGLTALGVTGVTTSNITAVKAAIAGHADGTAVDTVQEIKDLLKPVVAQQVLREYTDTNGTSTAPTLMIYTDAGIKTFKSLLDTGVSNRKALNDSSTASGAESNTFLTAAILNTALDKLAGTSLTYDATYTGTVQKMVDSYYRILREADGKYIGDSNGGATYYNDSDVAHTADTDVYNDGTNDGTNATNYNDPILADYANIGINVADAISTTAYNATTAVGNETLDLLNDAIGRMSTASVDTVGEIETLATTANDVMLLAKGTNISASQTDANLITGLNLLLGLNITTGVNTNNIVAMKDALVATADTGLAADTVAELLSLLGLVRLKAFTDDGAAIGAKSVATPTLNDWSVLNLTANTSLTDGTDVKPLNTATYWKTTNPTNGLNALNSALDTFTSGQLGTFDGTAMSLGVLQAIVDSYGRILQEADGSRATDTDVSKISNITSPVDLSVANTSAKDVLEQDLINVGVKSALSYSNTGELLASSIGSLASTAVDTVAELNNLVDIAENVMKQAAGGAGVSYTTDAQWVTALVGLGLTGATSSNMAAIKTAIDTADVAGVGTYDELQAIVSLVRVNDYAALNTGYALPTLADYQILTQQGNGSHAYTDAKSTYLNAYNDAINFKTGVADATVVEDMVVAYNLILDSADGTQTTTPTGTALASVDDYAKFGVTVKAYGTTVLAATTATTLDSVISGLNTGNVDTVGEVQTLESIIGKIMTMAANIKTTGAVVGDYTGLSQADLGLLGLKGSDNSLASASNVSGTELAYFNDLVIYSNDTGTGVNDFAKLQTLLNNAIVAG